MKNITITHKTLNKWLTGVIYFLTVWKLIDIAIWGFKGIFA